MNVKGEKWYDAIASCQAIGSVLARPNSETQIEALKSKLNLVGTKNESYWIGPYNNKVSVSNTWMFDTGYPLKYFNWTTGRGIYRDNTVTRLNIWFRFVVVSKVLTKHMSFQRSQ